MVDKQTCKFFSKRLVSLRQKKKVSLTRAAEKLPALDH